MTDDLRERLFDLVRRDQPRFELEPGLLLLRGVRVVIVLAVEPGSIRWRDEDGSIQEGAEDVFWERSVQRIDLPDPAPWLDRVWQIASARGLPIPDRIAALRRVLLRAPDDETKQIVVSWISGLALGREPERLPR